MIDGDFFQSVAHVTYSDNMELHHNYGNHPDISNVIMYAKTEDQDEAVINVLKHLGYYLETSLNGTHVI